MIHVTHFLRRPRAKDFSLERVYADVRDRMPPDVRVATCVNRHHSQGLLNRLSDALRAWRHQGDVNHVTGDVHFLTYLLRRERTVLTILDCIRLEELRGFRRWLLWLLWYWLPEKRCAAIVVISEATRQQVLRHLRCDPEKVRVIHCGVSEEFRPVPKEFAADRPRILHIGTAENKNLERHAEALRGLECELVVIGELSEAQRAALERNGVRYESHAGLSREEMLEQYHRCDLLLFASTYEGFGLPIVEAQAVGRPVVTSSVWSMPEVAGEGACLVDPFDVASIRAGVARVCRDEGYRSLLVSRGFENVGRFRVEGIARRYADLYRELHASLDSHPLQEELSRPFETRLGDDSIGAT